MAPVRESVYPNVPERVEEDGDAYHSDVEGVAAGDLVFARTFWFRADVLREEREEDEQTEDAAAVDDRHEAAGTRRISSRTM